MVELVDLSTKATWWNIEGGVSGALHQGHNGGT